MLVNGFIQAYDNAIDNVRPHRTLRKAFINLGQRWLLLLCLLFPLICSAEQFVDLTAEVESDDWSYLFLSDQNRNPKSADARSIFQPAGVFHCVVGANTWFVERQAKDQKTSYWFTGSNIIEQTVAPYFKPYTMVFPSVDGSPGRPVRVADLMTMNATARVCWLAFCSGPFLKHDGRKIYPPSDLWKESRLAYSGWSDKTTMFNDEFGLPKSLTLFTTNNQPVVQYQAHESTNVLGWNFPSEFYLVQYMPAGTNEWKLHMTIKGRITSIGAGTMPPIPKEALKPDWVEK